MSSLNRRISALEGQIQELQDGAYPQSNPLGPGRIKASMIAGKSIVSNLINVTDLESVNTNTGNLVVTGGVAVSTAGNIHSGQTAYDTGVGFWMEYNAGIPRFSLGNSAANKLTWDGTTLAITGNITATTGTIGGWTVGTTDLTGSAGVIGLASSGSIRIWSGHSTPSLANFQVSSTGALTAQAGTIGGWDINGITGIQLGTGATQRGMDTGSIAFYAGSSSPSTAPFRVSTAGALTATNATITGAITATSGSFSGAVTASSLSITGTASFSGGSMTLPNGGSITSTAMDLNQGTLAALTVDGTITLGAGGKITDADGSYWDQTGITLISAGAAGDCITWKNGASDLGYIFATSAAFLIYAGTSKNLSLAGDTLTITSRTADVNIVATHDVFTQLGDTGGTYQFKVADSGGTPVWGVNSNGDIVFVGTDFTAAGAYYGRRAVFYNGLTKYIHLYDA